MDSGPFVFSFLAIVLHVRLRFSESDKPFDILTFLVLLEFLFYIIIVNANNRIVIFRSFPATNTLQVDEDTEQYFGMYRGLY